MPTRIEPQTDADGQSVELTPPAGGSWLRDADGGLTPANEPTAIGAGLDWPAAAVAGDHDQGDAPKARRKEA
jgi:hypothetical protein